MNIQNKNLNDIIINDILPRIPPNAIKLLGYVAEGTHYSPVDWIERDELHYGSFTGRLPEDILSASKLTYKTSTTEGRLIEWNCLVYKEIDKNPSNQVKIHFNEYSFKNKKGSNDTGSSKDYMLEEWLNLNK